MTSKLKSILSDLDTYLNANVCLELMSQLLYSGKSTVIECCKSCDWF